MDTTWTMIQEQGYYRGGTETVVTRWVIESHGWSDPLAAQENWRARGVYRRRGYQPYENGRQRTIDVSSTAGYAGPAITAIFDRVYFVLTPADQVPESSSGASTLLASA